jgi:hypothetical protein
VRVAGNSSIRESSDKNPVTTDTTPNDGNDVGTVFHEGVIPIFVSTGDPSIHNTCQLHQSSQLGGHPFIVVKTTRTSLPDTVEDRSSLLDNPSHVLTCRTLCSQFQVKFTMYFPKKNLRMTPEKLVLLTEGLKICLLLIDKARA